VWERSGDGPYFEPGGAVGRPDDAPLALGAATAASAAATRWTQSGVELFARPHHPALARGDGDGGGGGGGGAAAAAVDLPPLRAAHRVTVLDADTRTMVLFTRREGPPGTTTAAYPVRFVGTPLNYPEPGDMAHTHALSVGYASTWAEQVSAVATMSTAEFATDLLEYISLFSGACFYTLVSYPLNKAVLRRQRGAGGHV